MATLDVMHSSVLTVLRDILEDSIDAADIEKQVEDDAAKKQQALARLKDDLINLQQLQEWFLQNLVACDEHTMSMKDIWRNFCYDHGVYCSLALFGNLVYRHVFTNSGHWAAVTRVGETNAKKYNLRWGDTVGRAGVTEDQLDNFFAFITEEKERSERLRGQDAEQGKRAKSVAKISPEQLVQWWSMRLEPAATSDCTMKMREIWARFTKETGVHISLALFGELSVRYVMRSNPTFANVVRTRGIHDKKCVPHPPPSIRPRSVVRLPIAADSATRINISRAVIGTRCSGRPSPPRAM